VHISTFLIICNIHVTFGHNVQPIHCSRIYSEPLGIYVMSFRSFPTLHDLFRHFRCFPHTIVYLSDVFPTLSDLFLSLFISALINVPMFLIVDRFHWFQCYYTFGLWSLQTISHIWTLLHHLDPSDVTITYTLPTTPIYKKRNTLHFAPKTL
jgi:hypothetical protein